MLLNIIHNGFIDSWINRFMKRNVRRSVVWQSAATFGTIWQMEVAHRLTVIAVERCRVASIFTITHWKRYRIIWSIKYCSLHWHLVHHWLMECKLFDLFDFCFILKTKQTNKLSSYIVSLMTIGVQVNTMRPRNVRLDRARRAISLCANRTRPTRRYWRRWTAGYRCRHEHSNASSIAANIYSI